MNVFFLSKPCQFDTVLFDSFPIHLWSQLREAEHLIKDQRDLAQMSQKGPNDL